MALTPHPPELGSKLTHAKITTDYSENLLEFITGVHSSTSDLLKELYEIHCFTSRSIGEELLWASSMPSILPEDEKIPLAYYGESNVGKLKTLYRRGLGHRYGRSMQSIAGIHYNFSLSENFWKHYHQRENSNLSLQEFKNDKYFGLIRNFKRYSWLLVYLYGATPLVDKSFLKGKKHKLEKFSEDTYYSPYATSLRMGGLGYTSNAQNDIQICYNQLSTYISTLEKARLTPFKQYEDIGLVKNGKRAQLNVNLLQIDNEFYSTIRPKNIAKTRESALGALHKRGIEYIEVRLIDVNPYTPLGITKEQVDFIQLFLIWCLSLESPQIENEECAQLDFNFNQIVNFGRKSDLELFVHGEKKQKRDVLNEVFSQLSQLANKLSPCEPDYNLSVTREYEKVENEAILPSSLVINQANSRDKSFIKYQLELAKKYKTSYSCSDISLKEYLELAKNSLDEQKNVEANDKLDFDDFLNKYFEDIKIT